MSTSYNGAATKPLLIVKAIKYFGASKYFMALVYTQSYSVMTRECDGDY
jgi:hypothetical protein